MEQLLEYLKDIPAYVEAALAIVGGLKIFAKLTKTQWDDKVLDKIGSALAKCAFFFPKKKK